jgi:hypothetical protein
MDQPTPNTYAPLSGLQFAYLILIAAIGFLLGAFISEAILTLQKDHEIFADLVLFATVCSMIFTFTAMVEIKKFVNTNRYLIYALFLIVTVVSGIGAIFLIVGFNRGFFISRLLFIVILSSGLISLMVIIAEKKLKLFAGILFLKRLVCRFV